MNYKNTSKLLISALVLFSIYCAWKIGSSLDAPYHYTQGSLRALYISSLGKFDKYIFANSTHLYPALYDTLNLFLLKLLISIFPHKYYSEIIHFIHLSFSLLTLLGLFLLIQKLFNKKLAYLTTILCFFNPFFFGHMAMNPKDTIICFSFIWFSYYAYKYYETFDDNNVKNLLLASFFMGFGLGTRVAFFLITVPIFIFILIFLFKKNELNFNFLKKIIFHALTLFLVSTLIMIIAWPQIHDGSFSVILEALTNSKNYPLGPKLGFLNGEFYKTSDTPRTYLLFFMVYRMPLFILFLIVCLFFILLNSSTKNFFINLFDNFKIKFMVISILLLFPCLTAVILKVKLYDGIRLFLFLMPIVSFFSALGLYYIIENLSTYRHKKVLSILTFFLFVLFISRFISLTPYQYDYTNYLNPKFSTTENLYEHDYWGVSNKELIYKLSKSNELKNFINSNVAICGSNPWVVKYYIQSYIGIRKVKKFTTRDNADYIFMINRTNFRNVDKEQWTCFQKFKGETVLEVKRMGLTLSKLIKVRE